MSFFTRLGLLPEKSNALQHVLRAGSGLFDLGAESGILLLELRETGARRLRTGAGSDFIAFELCLGGERPLSKAGQLVDESPDHRAKLAKGGGLRTFLVGH